MISMQRDNLFFSAYDLLGMTLKKLSKNEREKEVIRENE